MAILDQAIEADPQNPASRGNRAIVFEYLSRGPLIDFLIRPASDTSK